MPLRLVPPSRLVGRDEQVAALEAAFDDALAGGCRGVLVAGAPGVGKTALIDQLRPVVTGQDGWFVAGKFDQYRRDLEFDAVQQAFQALCRLLLAEPDEELAEVRGRILRALGPNAGLMTAVSSEAAALLAVPPDPGDPLTAQARVQWAGVQMLRAVASRKRPVLIFLDDLQWAGRPPLGLVDLVLSGEPVDGLLLVGAHREVDAVHPLAALVARWRGQAGVRQVRLQDLSGSGQVAMVAEMLHLDHDAAAGLAGLIAPYTRGNPYETVELLNALRQGEVLTATAGGWRWDAAAVRAHLGAADPTQLLAGRVAALPAPSQHMVQAMAGLGGRAELDLLATATGATAGEVERCLEPVLDKGLLVAEPGARAVRFRHDRIREAVLAGLDAERRRGLHLTMARRLAGTAELFAVAAEQYLPVVDAVTDAAERRRVVGLLRHAADQAGLIGDYALVSALLGAAARLVDPGETATLLAMRTARHAALFSAGRLDEADEEYRAIDGLGLTAIERADATAVQVLGLTLRNRLAEAIALGVGTLRQLGIAVPTAGRLGEDLDRQFGHLYRWLERADADELARPEITDPTLLATTRLLNASLPATYFAGDLDVHAWVCLEAVRIWLDHGPAPTLVGPAGNAAFAAVTLRSEEAAAWFRALRRILAVGEARGYEPGTSQARFMFAGLSWLFEPIEDGVEAAQRAREGLSAGGELAYAGYTYYTAVYHLLDCAPSLDAVDAEVRAGLAFMGRTGNEQAGQTLDGYRWLVGALRGESSTAAEAVPTDRYAGNPLAVFHAHVTRAVAAAVLGDLAGLARHTAAAMPLLSANSGAYPPAVARLLRGLAVAEQARSGDGSDRDRLLAELDELTGWLAARAADAPANFEHLVRLLEAERAWAVGDFPTAVLAFDAALGEVSRRQRPWHKALTVEHAARFYLAHGQDHTGHQLLAQARQAYAAWGATAKVAHLDWAYPTLRPAPDTSTEPGVDQRADRSTTIVTSGTIDLLGILAASQAISSETTIQRLHTRVAAVLGAMTGATSVRLLLWSDEHHGWLTPTPGGATPIDGREHTAPMTVLRYVHRTQQPLLVADTAADDRFARDAYLTDAAGCSLLAVPILSRGALRAVLLLENRLIRGAFTTDRLDAVTLIAGQLAVSLDNAQLYADLTASRQRIVATADLTRRRIERDLHDGAQQRLVSIALQLRAAQAAVPPDLERPGHQAGPRGRRGHRRPRRTTRDHPRHPLVGPDHRRAAPGAAHPGPPRPAPGRAARARRWATARAGRDRRVLHRRRGADQHRQIRPRLRRHHHRRHHHGHRHHRAAPDRPRRRRRRRRPDPRHRPARPQRPRRGPRRTHHPPQPTRRRHHPARADPAHRGTLHRISTAHSMHGSSGRLSRARPAWATAPARAQSRSAEPFEDHRHALATADAHGREAHRLVAPGEAVEQGAGDPGPGHAERVAERDRAAVDVQPVQVDPQVPVGRDDLRRERLVDLHQIDVIDRSCRRSPVRAGTPAPDRVP